MARASSSSQGSDTCLRVGGFVLAQLGIQPSSQLYRVTPAIGAAITPLTFGGAASGLAGYLPTAAQYVSNTSREIYGFNATGRIELDARTQSPFGTVRSFIRLDANFGAGANYATGSLATALGTNGFNTSAGPTINRELVFLSKGFIQFAGVTAGRAQSFFDFYADAINYAGLYGSNATVWTAAYTYTAGGGFSITGGIEDPVSRRGPVANVANVGGIPGIVPGAAVNLVGGGVTAFVGRVVMPEIIANVRWDQPWGAVQLSGALHNIQAHLYPTAATLAGAAGVPTAYAEPVVSASKMGFAIQGGVQFNINELGQGDKLWLQATYARGAIGYVQGNNLAFNGGLNGTANYGVGNNRSSNSPGWTGISDNDCVFNYTGSCDRSQGFAFVAAMKHFWTPTISSGLFGGYYQVKYSNASQYPVNPFTFSGLGGSGALFTSGHQQLTARSASAPTSCGHRSRTSTSAQSSPMRATCRRGSSGLRRTSSCGRSAFPLTRVRQASILARSA